MTLAEIEKEYNVTKFEKYYSISSKEPIGRLTPHKYLCGLIKNGSNFKIKNCPTNKTYSDINLLKLGIDKFISELKYDSEFYNIGFRKGVFEELVVHNYLKERGFKSKKYSTDNSYILENKNIYGGTLEVISLTIDGLSPYELKDEIKIQLWLSDSSWMESKCNNNVDEIIENINSIIKPLLLTEGINFINNSDKFNFDSFDATVNQYIAKSMSIESLDYKAKLKEKLQLMIDKL